MPLLRNIVALTLLHTALLVTHAQAQGNAAQKYQKECAACHIAYPAQALPAPSWQNLMNSLDKHFGNNAALSAADTKQIASWLTANAGRDGGSPPQNRITKSNWFTSIHGGFPPAVWSRPAIHTASNCSACHQGAGRGSFDEDEVRVPS